MSLGKRVTLKDIAERAEVSISTVSLALRNHGRIPKETISRVQQIANDLGYAPDPWLSSLSSYRNSEAVGTRNTTIAVLSSWPTKYAWRESPTIKAYYAGAQKMAAALGYKLEDFWIEENGGPKRTASILFNRGIKGILLLPLPPEETRIHFDFSNFSVAQVGRTLHWPIINTVTHNHYGSMQISVYFLRRLGYKRIGLAIPSKENKLHRLCWLASFLAKQYDFPESMAKIPVYKWDQLDKSTFLQWLDDNQCDVVVSSEPQIRDFMLEAGKRVPEDVGFCCLCIEDDTEISGIHLKSEIIGSHAISLLHMLMMSGHRGCPQDPMTQVIDGAWQQGNTLLGKKADIEASA